MAQVILAITLALTVARTLFVVDAIQTIAGHHSLVRRTAQVANATIISIRSAQVSSSSIASPRPSWGKQLGAGASKVRSLHLSLVTVHVAAILGQFAAVLKYTLPVTVSNCRVTTQLRVAFTFLTDMALVVFLLAKVKVTNGSRTLATWESGIVWLSRVFAWVYSPFVTVAVSVEYPGGTNEEGTHCYDGFDDDERDIDQTGNALGYSGSNAGLMVQFVLLMLLFVRPLLVPVEGTQSGGASYRRVVIRNVVCTTTIVMAYLITTVLTTYALLNMSPDDYANSQVADTVPMINQLVTLCLTEVKQFR
ncbi:unnamed protein product [Hapterophycus canaliculatus]